MPLDDGDSRRVSPSLAPHAASASEVQASLSVDHARGLTRREVELRSASFGANRLPESPARPAWSVFLGQFKSVLILILLGAATLAAVVGSVKDAVVILAVVLINAAVGFYQEYRAERSLAALKDMLPQTTRVRRDGVQQAISADAVVPGDVVLLEAGDRVPADGRLVVAAGVEVDESALTGESQATQKRVDARLDPSAPLGDRVTMVYMNTMLTRGRAECIVTGIGSRTEMGKLSKALAGAIEPPTPLQLQLDRLGKRLGAIALTLVGLLAFLELLRGEDLAHVVLDSIALAVAAMPEGLPVVVTVTLAIGMRKMARQRAIVKRLASVETLGCTTVICSDKTGTLTVNQMTARVFLFEGERFDVSGQGYSPEGTVLPTPAIGQLPNFSPMAVALVACNDSRVDGERVVGDPMEGALIVLARKACPEAERHAAEMPRVAEVAFDSARKFMATFHRRGDAVTVFVKGAPDVLLARCTSWRSPEGVRPLSRDDGARIEAHYESFASSGNRGLLIATRTFPSDGFDASGDLLRWTDELTFIALVGMMDPPRAEAHAAIAECHKAGIAVKMITGDHRSTGAAIARELGLRGASMTGAELDRLDSIDLADRVDEVDVFARVSPEHKVKIVRALQAKGHVVAMTGDGVNDAPALKTAHIGIAMGITGTAVSKEAATMILSDDNFATIVSAVRHGRALYDNLLKFVRFQLSTTIGAILTVFFAPLAGLPEPFTPLQILWIAIIMDGPPAIALALDAARPGVMKEAPRSQAAAILPFARMTKIFAYGITMMVGTLAVLHHALLTGPQDRALTLAFTTFVLFQVFNVFNARNESGSAFNRYAFRNAMLWASLAAVVALQAIAVHWSPAMEVFGTSGMTIRDWALAAVVASSVLVLEEGRKLSARALRVLAGRPAPVPCGRPPSSRSRTRTAAN